MGSQAMQYLSDFESELEELDMAYVGNNSYLLTKSLETARGQLIILEKAAKGQRGCGGEHIASYLETCTRYIGQGLSAGKDPSRLIEKLGSRILDRIESGR